MKVRFSLQGIAQNKFQHATTQLQMRHVKEEHRQENKSELLNKHSHGHISVDSTPPSAPLGLHKQKHDWKMNQKSLVKTISEREKKMWVGEITEYTESRQMKANCLLNIKEKK